MQTNDYEIFDFFNSNRSINECSVKKIIESIKKIGYVAGKPILVNKDFIIIDGQHRFEACKRLGLPIIYEEININEHEAIIALNTNQRVWSLMDYVQSWANQGKKCYIELIKFEAKYKLGSSNSIIVLFGNASHTPAKIRSGYDFTKNSNSENIVKFLYASKEHIYFWKDKSFVQAVISMHNKTTQENINKLLSKITVVKRQNSIIDYLTVFENLINKSIRNNINRVNLSK